MAVELVEMFRWIYVQNERDVLKTSMEYHFCEDLARYDGKRANYFGGEDQFSTEPKLVIEKAFVCPPSDQTIISLGHIYLLDSFINIQAEFDCKCIVCSPVEESGEDIMVPLENKNKTPCLLNNKKENVSGYFHKINNLIESSGLLKKFLDLTRNKIGLKVTNMNDKTQQLLQTEFSKDVENGLKQTLSFVEYPDYASSFEKALLDIFGVMFWEFDHVLNTHCDELSVLHANNKQSILFC